MVVIVFGVVILAVVASNRTSYTSPAANPKTPTVTSSENQNTTTSPSTNPNTSGSSTSSGSSTTSSNPKAFTLVQVATHNSPADCYSAINGIVYNLTLWISRHPGGERAILSICGKDGSAAFDGQHGGDPRAASVLAGYEVGTLIK